MVTKPGVPQVGALHVPQDPDPTAGEIEWRDPGPSRRGFGARGGVWVDRLRPLMDHPGRWAVVYKTDKQTKASGMAAALRQGKTRKPEGKWDIRSRGLEVFAQYVGPE